MSNNTNENTAAYGCELIIKSKTETVPRIKESVTLLFVQSVAERLCNANVKIPAAAVPITAIS